MSNVNLVLGRVASAMAKPLDENQVRSITRIDPARKFNYRKKSSAVNVPIRAYSSYLNSSFGANASRFTTNGLPRVASEPPRLDNQIV